MEWGVGPGGQVSHRGCCPAEILPAGHILEGTVPGPVRFQGRVARCVIQNWSHVLSAPRRAWNLNRNNGARRTDSRSPGQPVVSYVGYSLKETCGAPRVVIGIDADEADPGHGRRTGGLELGGASRPGVRAARLVAVAR
jgi:hypothetical protein